MTTLCHCSIKPSLQGNNDIMNLASTLAGNFMGVVQYNRDNRAFEVSDSNSHIISHIAGMV